MFLKWFLVSMLFINLISLGIKIAEFGTLKAHEVGLSSITIPLVVTALYAYAVYEVLS